ESRLRPVETREKGRNQAAAQDQAPSDLLRACPNKTPSSTSMNYANRLLSRVAICAAIVLLAGCTTTTTMKLSGSSGSAFTGHYVSRGFTNSVSGNIPMVIKLPGVTLQSCEFRKTKVDDTLILEIYHGGHQ